VWQCGSWSPNAGPADYVLFVNRQAVGVIEAKKKGTTLSGVEWQTVKYQANVPDALRAYSIGGCLPYGYESTGDETWFTCRMDPEPTARRTFWFHRPETLEWQVEDHVNHGGGTLRAPHPRHADSRATGPGCGTPLGLLDKQRLLS
jgi:type I restriction enzyme, R subunit